MNLLDESHYLLVKIVFKTSSVIYEQKTHKEKFSHVRGLYCEICKDILYGHEFSAIYCSSQIVSAYNIKLYQYILKVGLI